MPRYRVVVVYSRSTSSAEDDAHDFFVESPTVVGACEEGIRLLVKKFAVDSSEILDVYVVAHDIDLSTFCESRDATRPFEHARSGDAS